jgi:hypothetical protein
MYEEKKEKEKKEGKTEQVKVEFGIQRESRNHFSQANKKSDLYGGGCPGSEVRPRWGCGSDPRHGLGIVLSFCRLTEEVQWGQRSCTQKHLWASVCVVGRGWRPSYFLVHLPHESTPPKLT